MPEIVRLKALIMTTSYPFDVRLADHPDWPERASAGIRTMIDHPDYTFLVAGPAGRAGGRLAGCLSVGLTYHVPGPQWGGRHAYVADMCTDEPYRGRGLGRVLMAAALDWCRDRGAQTVRLDATPSAVAFYEHLGFERGEDRLFPSMRRTL